VKNINLKGNVEVMDISDLETAAERTELGPKVSKTEQPQRMIQFSRSLSGIHLEYTRLCICHPTRSLSGSK